MVWVNEWFNPPKETEAAQSLINGGADVLMQNTDSSAVLQTAEKAGKHAFGWDSDMTAYAPKAHLASAIINWAPYYIKAVQDALDGSWKGGGGAWWGVKEGAIDIVSISDKVPADIKTKVESVKAGLKDGSFVDLEGPDHRQRRQGSARRRTRSPTTSSWAASTSTSRASRARSRAARRSRAAPAMDFGRIARERLPELLCAMPKAELHIHIEGSLEPELIFELARKNGVALAYPDVESLRAAYAFTDLQSFLDIYYAGASVLLHESDFEAMAMAYFRRAAADNVVRAELFFDPQTHTARGVPIGAVIRGLASACARAERELGLSSDLILCFLRHLSEDEALQTLHDALPYRQHFIGVGLDSSERGHPPEKFARVFAEAGRLGLHRVAHAGEEGPPAYIESALDVLEVERIDHGVRCLEDPALVRRLAAARVPLTVCPLSNVKLCVYGEMESHRLPELLEAGICATVNSDDPAYFGGYMNANFLAAFAALPPLGAAEAYALARNSFEASFVAADARAAMTVRLDQLFARFA